MIHGISNAQDIHAPASLYKAKSQNPNVFSSWGGQDRVSISSDAAALAQNMKTAQSSISFLGDSTPSDLVYIPESIMKRLPGDGNDLTTLSASVEAARKIMAATGSGRPASAEDWVTAQKGVSFIEENSKALSKLWDAYDAALNELGLDRKDPDLAGKIQADENLQKEIDDLMDKWLS